VIRRATALLALAALLGACMTRELRATASDLEVARHLLREGKPAPVRTVDNEVVEVRPEQTVELIDVAGRRTSSSLREIIADCKDHEPEEGRLCELRGIDRVVIGHRRETHPNAHRIPLGVAVLGVVGGLVYCASECGSPTKELSGGGLGAFGLLVLYVGVRYVRSR